MSGLCLDEWQKEILNTKGNIVLCSGRQIGKSTIIAIRDAEYACKNNNKSVLIISATERQASELFIKVLNYIEEHYNYLLMKKKDKPTRHIIKLSNGSVIRCLPTGLAGIGIRGFTIDRLTADEAAFIPDEVWAAVTPMLLTTGGDIVLLSTPHGRKGYFYERYNDKTFKVFHVKSEEVIQNRAISGSWTLTQRERALEHLEREKQSMTKLQYAQEYLGEFIDELRQFFPDELIVRCMKLKRLGKINPNSIYFLGVDVARMGEDECTFQIIDRTDRKHLIHVENIIIKKQYLNEVYNRIIELDKLYKFKSIYIDDGGIGVGVFDYLLENEQTKRKVIAVNNRSRPLDPGDIKKKKILKEDLYNNLLGLMERGEIDLLDDDEIFQSFKSVQFEYTINAKALTNLKIFGVYTHIVEGLIRAAFCVKDKRLNIWVR
jgi:hypothetical protein